METTLTLQNGTVLYADSSEQPSLAPLMLAHFAAPGNGKRVAEFCAGNGCCSFWLLDRGFRGETVLVDLRPEPLALAEKTARANGFEGVTVLQADVASFRGGRLFDAVLCNPPFFDERDASADPDRLAVRHENGLDPGSLCRSAAVNLKQRGRLYVCYVPERLTDMLCAMRQAGLEPKRLRFCRHEAGRQPFLVLIDASLRGGKGLTVLPDLLVRDGNGEYTPEMKEICERGYE